MIKGSVLQEVQTMLNVYTPNTALNYMRQQLTELHAEMDKPTITAGDFRHPLPEMDRPSRQKIRKDITELNNTIKQLDVIEIPPHPTTAENTFFSSSQATFTKIDHILGHRTHLKKLKSIEIIQYFALRLH